MTDSLAYLIDASILTFDETNVNASWVHALPIGAYKHPIYGTIDVSMDRAKRFAESVVNRVRGTVDPSINYEHNQGEASGWVKNAEARSDGLWLFVEWVKDAADKIREKKFRYFSAEFAGKWKNPEGKEFTDVVIGGALTNRPFMKNLVPINLSESTYEQAYELIAFSTGVEVDTLKGGPTVPLSDEELTTLATKLKEMIAPANTPPVLPVPATKLTEMPELVALAADNPLVRTLIDTVELQNQNLANSAEAMKQQAIVAKLSEFDQSKIVLTPVARQQVLNLLNKMPVELHEEFWGLLNETRKGSTMLVELGERAGATVNYGSVKSAVQEFNDCATKLMSDDKLSFADAYTMVAEREPKLWARYRKETAGV